MKRKLYANIKRLTTTFCVCIFSLTALIVILRLTLFRDMAAEIAEDTSVVDSQEDSLVEGQEISYSLNSTIYFPNAASAGDILVTNHSSQSISVSIMDPATRDTYIYTGSIPAGGTRDQARLDLPLDAGTYALVARITAYNQDLQPLGSEEIPVTVYVGEND